MNVWKGLALHLVIGIVVATLVVVLDEVFGLRVDPTLGLLSGAVVATAFWTLRHLTPADESPQWEQPSWHTRSAHLQADIRTRRLASVLTNAQPGRGFDARGVARHLAQLTARRLVTSGRLPDTPDDQDRLDGAQRHLSPALLSYLRSAEGEHPKVLNRKTLHAHLKEIDSL